jgi:bacteriorhodopsin
VTDTTTDLPPGLRRGADRAFAYLAALFFLGLLVQIYLAGVGVFGDHVKQVEDATSFEAHRNFGFALGIVALVLLVLALLARVSQAVVISTLVLAVLAIVMQSLLAAAGDDNEWAGGLHALDGIVILLLAGWLTGAAHRREAARRRTGTTATP